METETDITFEELKEAARVATTHIKASIRYQMKSLGLSSLPISSEVPYGICLDDKLKDQPNRQMACLLEKMERGYIAAWYIIVNDYSKHPINQREILSLFGLPTDNISDITI